MLDNTLKLITGSKSLSELELVRVKILGKQGLLKAELKKLKQEKNIDKRKKLGEKLNRLKLQILSAHQKRRKDLLKTKQIAIDPTLPGKKIDVGAIHPVGQTINSVRHIFEKIGFYQVSYPGIEYEYFSFDSLNMPPSHPARDEFESFLVDGPASPIYGKMVLSPHTSSAQVREMWRMKNKPIRMINIARCFRRNWDVTHVPMFHQFEGLCIDKNINITHLKGTIEYFVKEYFGHDVKIRLRPFHFQFTEPSFEIDIACTICHGTTRIKGKKCRVCKGGWLELGGAGMVHPYVLRQGKINPQKFSGWAFGFGVERVYMMKYQLFDLRKLFSGQLDIYESENEY